MATIGEIAASGKPWHVGHDSMVRTAAAECDEVHLWVSTSDRARSGEVPVLGSDMAMLWKRTIEQSLPENVKVSYGGSPIWKMWNEIGEANEVGSTDTYIIYADETDLSQNFAERDMVKYGGELYRTGRLKKRATPRGFSGTKMRQFLEKGDKEEFMKHLPKGVDKELVWSTLHATARNPPVLKKTAGASRKRRSEALLRQFVKLVLG